MHWRGITERKKEKEGNPEMHPSKRSSPAHLNVKFIILPTQFSQGVVNLTHVQTLIPMANVFRGLVSHSFYACFVSIFAAIHPDRPGLKRDLASVGELSDASEIRQLGHGEAPLEQRK